MTRPSPDGEGPSFAPGLPLGAPARYDGAMPDRDDIPAAPRFLDVALPLPVRRSFSYRLPAETPAPAPGCRVRVPLGAGVETGVVLRVLDAARLEPALRDRPERVKEILEVLDAEPWLDAPLLRLGAWLADYYGAAPGETLRAMIPVKPLKRPRQPAPEPTPPRDEPPRPTPAQSAALAEVTAALDAGAFAAFLLHGVTGSGKTEVYLRAIAHALDAGRQAIVLVPEISLTPQAARRFRARLGERVGIFHSGLGAGERLAVWRGAREGSLDVVLGPRSAVFAPLPRLGLVVIDEEHDGSYKQTEKPRYHARSVALVRARALGAVVVMGSATPGLESLHNARTGKYRLLSLPDRVGGGRIPRPELVDLREQEGGLLAPALEEALDACLGRGEKAMLLLNRRGHSRLRLCRDCGEPQRCSRCDIPLTYHSGRERLVCHYCGQERPLAPACPECGGRRWVLLGAGTQQLEMDLELRFPGVRVLRMDLDSTSRRGAHQRILDAFAAPGPALLLGTQMIAKGHHIPEVTLVGVVAADTGLFLPDYRAAERTWQLLEQVSGRAGRGERPGRVIAQTYNPDHPVLAGLAAGRSGDWVERELRDRRQLGYPPFRRLTSLLVSAPEEEAAEEAARRLRRDFRDAWPDSPAEMLGPAPAFLPRLKGRHRRQLLVKGRLTRDQKAWFSEHFAAIARAMRRTGALGLDLDVDPESLL